MLFMPWTTELETGIAEIDQQHRWLVDLTNQLHQMLGEDGGNAEALGEVLEQLVDYTMNHFIVEEELFARLGYPESDAHKAQHNVFTERIVELLTQYDAGEIVGEQALTLLKNWLTNHIVKVDKRYVEHFKQQGVVTS